MLKIADVKVGISDTQSFDKIIAAKLGVRVNDIANYRILRKSIDARKKDSLCYVYTFSAEVAKEKEILRKRIKNVTPYEHKAYVFVH